MEHFRLGDQPLWGIVALVALGILAATHNLQSLGSVGGISAGSVVIGKIVSAVKSRF